MYTVWLISCNIWIIYVKSLYYICVVLVLCILYFYDIPLLFVILPKFCLHRMHNMCICIMCGGRIAWKKGRMEGLVGSRVGLDAFENILLALSDIRDPFCRSSSPWSIYCTNWATPAPQFHDEPRTSIDCSSQAVNANPLSYRIKVTEVSFRNSSQLQNQFLVWRWANL